MYPDILKIFEYCTEKGLPMAIASKSPESKMYGQLMKLLDIHKYFIQFEIYRKAWLKSSYFFDYCLYGLNCILRINLCLIFTHSWSLFEILHFMYII